MRSSWEPRPRSLAPSAAVRTSTSVSCRRPRRPPFPASSFRVLPPDPLIGKWGVASYRDEKDRPAAEKLARARCASPYAIVKGPTDGAMMHVAEDPDPHELALKKGGDGRTYVGFNAPPGDPNDREIIEQTPKLMVMRFVDLGQK